MCVCRTPLPANSGQWLLLATNSGHWFCSVVETTTNYFSKNLPMKEILMIREYLKLIHFGMGNTLITFEEKYYEYDDDHDVNNKGLTIGGYESAWLADLVAAFVLENTQHMFKMTTFDSIYRDDGLVYSNEGKLVQRGRH
jgi:hypothetical protein